MRLAMKASALLLLAFVLSLSLGPAATASTDEWKVVDDDEWCEDRGWGSKYCEVREITLPADGNDIGVRTVNGSIRVEGWDRDEIYIKAKIQVRGSKRGAEEIASEITIDTDGTIRADGPSQSWTRKIFGGRGGWSVSYRVMVPHDFDLAVRSTNGSLHVEDVRGDIDFGTTNGSIRLYGVAGDLKGGSTNGGVAVTLDGRRWHGHEIDVHTTNGKIKLVLPEDFSADLDARTTNGGIRVDHLIRIHEKSRRRLRGTIGEGGTRLKARTTNGGISFVVADAG